MTGPFLFEVVDKLYNGAIRIAPDWMQETPVTNAFALGAVGTYSLTWLLQKTSKKVVDKVIPGFDEKALPILEKICIAGVTAGPLLYAMIDPEGAQNIMTQHPVYTSGMLGVSVGGVIAATQDLQRRRENQIAQDLTDRIAKEAVRRIDDNLAQEYHKLD
ncbi:hypothetical protein JW826_02135 [Candidatus Woesearchaeota archaeon]|nr:hypothetical protein [Candidatus Woesearchaeota archaeon]